VPRPTATTLMVSPPSPVSINHLLYRELGYDPRQFVAVALLAKVPNALVVRKDLPAGSIKELIAYGKANPGKLTYGSQGAGSTAHLSAGELEVLGGIKMVHVPYRGAVPALNDVIAGHNRHVLRHADHLGAVLARRQGEHPGDRRRRARRRRAGDSDHCRVRPTRLRSITWFALVAPPARRPPSWPRSMATSPRRSATLAGKLAGPAARADARQPRGRRAFHRGRDPPLGKVIEEAKITAQ